MAKLIYSAIMSLDGYIEDQNGKFDWAVPDEEVHRFVNDLERAAGTYLYGRRMYETMEGWETYTSFTAESSFARDFAAIWRAADKIVYSRTLGTVSTARTRIERDFDRAAVRHLKATSGQDILIGGPDLATQAFRARLVDECHLFLAPIVVGSGKRCLPDNVRLELELLAECQLWQRHGSPALPDQVVIRPSKAAESRLPLDQRAERRARRSVGHQHVSLM